MVNPYHTHLISSELSEKLCEAASSMVMFFSSVTILLENEWPLSMKIALGSGSPVFSDRRQFYSDLDS